MRAPLSKPHEVTTAWRRRCFSVRMPAAAVKVAWALYFGIDHGIAYAAQETLEEETGVDRGDIGKILRAMVQAGLIEAVEPMALAAAMVADRARGSATRKVGYRRILDPCTEISQDLAAIVVIGKPIEAGAEIRLKKNNKGSWKPELETKIRGNGASDPILHGGGHVTPGSDLTSDQPALRSPPDIGGHVTPEIEGPVPSPMEELDGREGNGQGPVSISPPVSGVLSGHNDTNVHTHHDQAGAPRGASHREQLATCLQDFPDVELNISRLKVLADMIGRAEIILRLNANRRRRLAHMTLDSWLRDQSELTVPDDVLVEGFGDDG